MREGISYSFLLNIIILFIFVSAAIVMGIFSYYKAFRANTIVISSIEKYEGYNCLSANEAAQKLSGISYNVPFQVTCKEKYGTPCIVDNAGNYAVVSYNLDSEWGYYVNSNSSNTDNKKYSQMNSQIMECDDIHPELCSSTTNYQYGVYTYMYVDLPVISSMIRIPFFAKTKVLHEFRNLVITDVDSGIQAYDLNYIPNKWIEETNPQDSYASQYTKFLNTVYGDVYLAGHDSPSEYLFGPGSRTKFQVDYILVNRARVSQGYNYDCGYTIDYSKY